MPGAGSTAGPPTWARGPTHTLNALDALTGDILWVYRYQPRPTPYYRSGWQDTLTQVNEPISLVAAAGGRVLFSPRWGDECVGLDGRSGRVLWSQSKGEARTLFAVDAQRCYLCGDEVHAFDLATGARRWTWHAPDSYAGLAALVENRVYVPVGPVVYVLDAERGTEVAQIDLRKHGVEQGYSAVTLLNGRLYLSQGDRLMAFEKEGP
jgi:outer membrane protein assembly factor BamB